MMPMSSCVFFCLLALHQFLASMAYSPMYGTQSDIKHLEPEIPDFPTYPKMTYTARMQPTYLNYRLFDDQNVPMKKATEPTRGIGGHMLKQPLLKFDVLWRKFGGNKRFQP